MKNQHDIAAIRSFFKSAFEGRYTAMGERLISEGATMAEAVRASSDLIYTNDPPDTHGWSKVIAKVNARFDLENPGVE